MDRAHAGHRPPGRLSVVYAPLLYQTTGYIANGWIAQVVAVDFHAVKAKGIELGHEAAQREHVFGGAHCLKVVFVNDHHEVVELLVVGHQHGLPDGALIGLTVADDGIDFLVCFLPLCPDGKSHAHRQPMPERTWRSPQGPTRGNPISP